MLSVVGEPMAEDRLSGALQENILTALCFDKEHSQIIRAAVSPQIFESAPYREVAGAAIDFIDQYKEPIGEHLPDVLEHILKGEDKRKADAYERLIQNLFLARESINGKYVVDQLQRFVRGQNMKAAIIKAVEAEDRGDIDAMAEAMQAGLTGQLVSFNPGLKFNDPSQAMGFADSTDEDPILTGIEPMDQHGVGPARKTLMMVIAPTNRGKSWWLMHLAKWGILQGWSVLYVTLEMSEKKVAARLLQSFYSLTRDEGLTMVPSFMKDSDGMVIDITHESIQRPSLANAETRAKMSARMAGEFKRRPNLYIKSFPTGSLTIPGFNAYLDSLERFEKFTPDMIVVDYAQLMKFEAGKLRESIGETTKELRGIGVARNAAMVSACQVNRPGMGATLIDEQYLSEDISQSFTADVMATYNQTDEEEALGIARLYNNKNRDKKARFLTLITQSYAIGQFCLDAVPMSQDYWTMVDDAQPPTAPVARKRVRGR